MPPLSTSPTTARIVALIGLALPAVALPAETRQLAVGERALISLPRPDARLNTTCKASVARLFKNEDSNSLEIEGVSPGECQAVIDGQTTTLVISDATSDRLACDQTKEVLRDTGLSVSCHKTLIYVSGAPYDDEGTAIAEAIASRYPGIVLDLQPLATASVQIDVVFLERRRQRGYDIGLDLSNALPSVLAGGLEAADTEDGIGWSVLSPLADSLSLEAVVARFEVMERRSVTVQLGEQAHLSSGGRAFYKITGLGSAELREIPFGFDAALRAQETSAGYKMDLDIRISEPVPGGTDADVELAERAVATTVGLKPNEVMVVATGESNRMWWRDRGIPLLHRIPVIGNLVGRDEHAAQPVQSAVLIGVGKPGARPDWYDQLEAVQERLAQP